MSAPGFHGKLPLAGDFVARRMPAPFLRYWDRWATRHLVPRLGAPWPAGGLRFHLGPPGLPGMTGLALPSNDRAGRRFPLTIAAPARGPALETWYDALAEAGAAAAAGVLDAASLDTKLLDCPPSPDSGPPSVGLLLWIGDGPPEPADAEAPGPALDALLRARAEAG